MGHSPHLRARRTGLYAYGVEFDEASNTILVSDYWNYRVKRFNKDTGALLSTFAKGIGAPYDMEVDADGHVWVAFVRTAGALAAQAGEALGKSDRGAQRVLGPILRRVGYGINHLDHQPVSDGKLSANRVSPSLDSSSSRPSIRSASSRAIASPRPLPAALLVSPR